MKKYNNNLGINLIALIVTIIVIFILAGVSINLINSDNSVLKRTIESKEMYDESKDKELHSLKELSDELPYPVIPVDTEATRNSVTRKKDVSSSNPVIPKGFKAINVGEAIWGTGDGYKKGLVIEDVGKDENTRGSQFVWIPVENYNDFHAIEGFWKDGANGRDTYTDISENEEDNLYEAGDSDIKGKPTIHNVAGTTESKEMYKSVKRFQGFYIARYEAGILGATSNSQLSEKTKQDGTVKPLSKANCGVWNSIPWGGNDNLTASDGLPGDDSADGAVKVARSMYNSSDYGAKSTLCYGVQWDAMMNFLDARYLNNNFTDALNEGDIDMVQKYGGRKTLAGLSLTGGFYSKNIADVDGNVFELTMEKATFDNNNGKRIVSRATRGGSFQRKKPASMRTVNSTDTISETIGFRVALIINY